MNETTNNGSIWIFYLLMGAMLVVMYFVSIRPQKKKEKELQNLRDNLQPGDEIMTIGGIYGTVIRVKDDRITIASGAEKTKIEFSKSAIANVTNREIPAPSKSASKEEAKPAKTIKKLSKKEETEEAGEQSQE